MNRFFTVLIGLFLFSATVAQDETEEDQGPASPYQWASIVKEVSSQKGVKQYSGEQALGRPNVLPSSGENPCAWMPSKEENKDGEIIRVRFAKPIFARQVIVCESYNPGAVTKIYFINTAKGKALIWKNDSPARMDVRKNVITHVLKKAHPTKVQEVEIHLNTTAVPGFNAIDAVGISESEVPYEVSINEIDDAFIGEPANMGNAINSAYDDFMPQISPDGKTLYFSRKEHPENTGSPEAMDIWKSESKDGVRWSNAEKMPAPLNDANHNYVYTITPDGNNLLMGPIFEDDVALGAVSMAAKHVDGWSEPISQTISEFYNSSPFNEFCLGASKKVMLMTLDRREGYGDNDIYVSTLNKDKTWSKPINLGAVVNSANVEASPFLAADGRTLYFSSNGFSGYGKMDLYMTRRIGNGWTKWSEPINLGKKINSQGDESYYSVPASGEFAYFVTNRKTLGLHDIFKIKLSEAIKPAPVSLITGQIINANTKQPIQGEVAYEILPEGIEVGIASTDPKSGDFKIALPHDHDYAFHAKLEGYIAISEHQDLRTRTAEYEELRRNIYVRPIAVGVNVIMKNVGFDRSKADLQEHSYPELDRLVRFLNDYPQIEIRLEGHTDNTGDKDLNVKLSIDRVETVKAYLVEKGVKPKRIATKGFGGAKPIAPNKSEETMKFNRRVEWVITKY